MGEDKIRGIEREKLMKYLIHCAKSFGFYAKGKWKDDETYLKGRTPDCRMKELWCGRKETRNGRRGAPAVTQERR